MLVEHARNLAGITDAVHAEYPDVSGTPVISLLACSLAANEIELEITAGSLLADLTTMKTVTERTTCNYGLNPANAEIASSQGLSVAAVDDTGEVRAVERTDHPFFLATLYQPQLSSTPEAPHAIFERFVAAVEGQA